MLVLTDTMNNFSKLSAESPEDRLAQMTSDEISEANAWFDFILSDSSARQVEPVAREATR
jgi:hypothetical protein